MTTRQPVTVIALIGLGLLAHSGCRSEQDDNGGGSGAGADAGQAGDSTVATGGETGGSAGASAGSGGVSVEDCETCQRTHCAEETLAVQLSEESQDAMMCWLGCTTPGCVDDCEVEYPEGLPTLYAALQCMADHCPAQCAADLDLRVGEAGGAGGAGGDPARGAGAAGSAGTSSAAGSAGTAAGSAGTGPAAGTAGNAGTR